MPFSLSFSLCSREILFNYQRTKRGEITWYGSNLKKKKSKYSYRFNVDRISKGCMLLVEQRRKRQRQSVTMY